MTYVTMDYMALDIILLGVLRAGPLHGYELKRRVQRPTLATLSNNSLYPTLKRFEDAGVLSTIIEEQVGKPARKVYAITAAGRRRFAELISSLPPEKASNEEEFLVRLGFFHEITPQQRAAILHARKTVLEAWVDKVGELRSEALAASVGGWRIEAMTEQIARVQRELDWISELSNKIGDESVAIGAVR